MNNLKMFSISLEKMCWKERGVEKNNWMNPHTYSDIMDQYPSFLYKVSNQLGN